MASVGVVDAASTNKKTPSETNNRPKKFYFGVFFDGTGNNMIQKEAAIQFRDSQRKAATQYKGAKTGAGSTVSLQQENKDWESEINHSLNRYGANDLKTDTLKDDGDYSNVAILHSVYQGLSPCDRQREAENNDIYIYNIYVEGAGTGAINRDSFAQDAFNTRGSGFGQGATGVTALVGKAVKMVKVRLKGFDVTNAEVHFHISGFSRGATCARLFSHLIVRKNGDPLPCENEFSEYFEKDRFLHFLDNLPLKSKTVDFLGIFDTVSSIGLNYDNNVTDYGLFSPNEDGVKHTFHLCAMDEFRENFAITDIGNAVNKGNNAEIYIPGCHSDVGGGYITGTDTFFLSYPSQMFISDPQNSGGRRMMLEGHGDVLQWLGWFDGNNDTNRLVNHNKLKKIECTRIVNGGYNTIPLRMMGTRAKKDLGTDVFAMDAIGRARYSFPKRLQQCGAEMVSFAEKARGRHFYFPGNTYLYKSLRNRFLHFSATDQILSKHTRIVHNPNKAANNTICRILYTGDNGNKTKRLLCDYNL